MESMGKEQRGPQISGVSVALSGKVALIVLIVCLSCPSSQGGFAEVLRAGTVRVKITPEQLGWLGGYGHRNRPAEGVAADLWARVLALEEGPKNRRVLVSADI